MKRFKDLLRKNGTEIFKVLFTVFMVGFIIISGAKEFKSIDFVKTVTLIRGFPIMYIFIFIVLGILAVSTISGYDFIIAKYLNLDIKSTTLLNITFVANTINNISGLGGLAGASIRAAIFKKSVNNKDDIIHYNLLLVPATGIGLSIMTIMSIFKYQYISPLIKEYKLLLIAIIIFSLYLILYLFLDKIFNLLSKDPTKIVEDNRTILRLKLLGVSLIEWMAAFALFGIVVRQFNQNINLDIIFIVFTLGSIAGILSLLPGGVGSFDLVVILGFQYYGISHEHILAVLILYRIFYYIVPLLIGMIFTLIVQSQSDNKLVDFSFIKIKDFINKTSSITSRLLSLLILTNGLTLLSSALVPRIVERIKIATKFLSFPILQLSICVGILLIVISKEIGRKWVFL